MIKILLVYYSQSGEAQRVSKVLSNQLEHLAVELKIERLQPRNPYPFPWKSIGDFFNVLPECHWGPLPDLEPVAFDPDNRFDLIILIYQVWFLSPSLPIQSFLKSSDARVLQNTKVLTISVSRHMWQSASERMKQLLRERAALHIDNAVLTHQGSAWATLVSTPRALLFGKKEGFAKVFPEAGISAKELDRVRRFGESIIRQLESLAHGEGRSLLRGQEAVDVDARYLLAERIGWYCFRWWGRLILKAGRGGRILRRIAVYSFVVFLVCGIPIVLPLTILIGLLFRPMLRPWMTSYAQRLQQPSEP